MSADPNLLDRSVFPLVWSVMSGSGRVTPRRGRRVRAWVGAVLLVGVVLAVIAGFWYAAVRDPASRDARPGASPSPTPLSEVDVSDRRIPRSTFCAALEQDDIVAALGGPVTRTAHYESGDRVTLAPGLTDVAHEYNCGYSAAGGATARAWVFAAPVARTTALRLVRGATGQTGCRLVANGPRFGAPSTASVCRTGKEPATVVTLRGLFGSSWLSCELTVPRASDEAGPVRRAERWCVQVATSMGSRR